MTDSGGSVLQVKTVLSEEGNSVLHFLPLNYHYVLTEDTIGGPQGEQQCLTLRCSLDSVDQVSSWLQDFQKRSHTKWIVGRGCAEPTRFLFRRQWFCHHSCLNKGKTKKSKSTNCTSKIDLKIKKITCDTRKKDEFLRLQPPLPTIIKIFYSHNHTTEYVVQRETFMVEFAKTQEQLQSEFLRLRKLISKNKPGLSAMTQFLKQLQSIKTESQLFESMRKVRLKPTVFPRVGRPPKSILGLASPPKQQQAMKKSKSVQQNKRLRTEEKDNGEYIDSRIMTKLIRLDPGTVLTEGEEEEPIEFHLSTLEEETEQPTATIDISYLFANENSAQS